MRMWKKPESLLEWFYNLVRPLFVRDIDPNEDYVCGMCGRPVLRRVLVCSRECHEKGVKMGWW